MTSSRLGVTQQEADERCIDQPHVLHRMVLFLATIPARWLSRIRGALDAPFGAIRAKRGERGAHAGAALGGPATPRPCVNACTDRVEASPSARRVARSTTRRT
jgi:hypothetical protein